MISEENEHGRSFFRGLKPEKILTVSEWADSYRVLTSKSSAEPGPWRTSRTPYLREVMDSLSSHDPCEQVVFIGASQLGKTESLNCFIGYIIDHSPGPALFVLPTDIMAKRVSKQRIEPLISSTERLATKVRPAKEKDSGNTILTKEFVNSTGVLMLVGANTPSNLSSMPIRFLMLDEVDRMKDTIEGDPVQLAVARTRTFSRRKIYMSSTPTTEGHSKIQSAFEEGDQRYFYVPCPHCGEYQTLNWENIKWVNDDPETVFYECASVKKCRIEEHSKGEMLAKGEWRATNPEAKNKIKSFKLSSLYSPPGWLSWETIVSDFLKAKKNPEKLKVFVNTILAECWKEKDIEAPDWRRLYDRREPYPIGKCPAPVCFLTAGADVQKDRIEVEVVGWANGKRSYSVDYRTFPGDTSDINSMAWKKLDELLTEQYEHESGSMLPIKVLAVDSGFNTQVVYSWARRYPMNRVMATKGSDTINVMLAAPTAVDVNVRGQRIRRGFRVWTIGVNIIKSELYGWLRLDKPLDGEGEPPGYCHFPEYAPEYFEQLTAERLVKKNVRGFTRLIWEKHRERNEALDVRVMARAAAASVGMDRFREDNWIDLAGHVGAKIESQKTASIVESQQTGPQAPTAPIQRGPIKRRRSNFL